MGYIAVTTEGQSPRSLRQLKWTTIVAPLVFLANHVCHRCLDEIVDLIHRPGAAAGDALASAIEHSVRVLNQRLAAPGPVLALAAWAPPA